MLYLRIAVFAALACLCLYGVGSPPLQETDEGFAANRAASFDRHDTWRLAFDDVDEAVPQFRKPLLLYWTVASLYRVIGWNEWAVRLPAALAGLAVCWLLFRMNRRFFDEATALAAPVLFCLVPFVLLHIRTAMLEMPVLACGLGAVYLLAFRPLGGAGTVLAGAAAAAAVLVKGGGGALYLVAAPLVGAVLRGRERRFWLETAGFLGVAAAVLGAYYLVTPAEWRGRMLSELFIKEGTHRFRSGNGRSPWMAFWDPLFTLARPLLVLVPLACASGVSLVRRRPDLLRWFVAIAILTVPVAWGAAHQAVPYPRYFLPLYPWLATLAALALTTWTSSPVRVSLVLLTATLTWFFPTARDLHPRALEQPYPGMEALAQRLPDVIPPGQPVIYAAGRAKCHQLLFYGRRPVTSLSTWLATSLRGMTPRHAVVRKGEWTDLPLITTTVLAEAGDFELLRLDVSPDRPDVTGILLCKPKDVKQREAEARARGLRVEPFDRGLLLLTAGR